MQIIKHAVARWTAIGFPRINSCDRNPGILKLPKHPAFLATRQPRQRWGIPYPRTPGAWQAPTARNQKRRSPTCQKRLTRQRQLLLRAGRLSLDGSATRSAQPQQHAARHTHHPRSQCNHSRLPPFLISQPQH
jgi:hypothetical protein